MRHKKKKVTLDRKKAPRTAMLRNMATSLVLFERIKTTRAKAKAVAPIVEKNITLAKKGDLHARRLLLSYFYDKKAVEKLMESLAKRYDTRKSGYTRITLLDRRVGDGAEMVLLELLDK